MHIKRRQSASVRGPRSEMTDNGDSAHTPEIPFDACETPKATVRRRNADDLDESTGTTLGDLERCVDHDKVEGQEPEIKRMPSILTTPGSAPDEKFGTDPRAPHPALVDPHNATSASEDGTFSAPPSPITYKTLISL